MRHLATLASLALLFMGTAEAAEYRHAAEYDGSAWKAMTEAEKMAYLVGFLAGIALEQAASSQGAKSQEVGSRIAALRMEGRLHFPFAPHVYKAQLEDYYFYQNHLKKTIPEALFEINRRLKPSP